MGCLKIKICGITRLRDALDACDLGADLLGFNFVAGSPRYLNPYKAREIMAALPPFVLRVGIFADEEPEVLNDMITFLPLDLVQLHGGETASFCRKVRGPVIKAVGVAEADDLKGLDEYGVSAYLLDARIDDDEKGLRGGKGRVFPWDLARDFSRAHRVFVAGGLKPENVALAVRTLAPFGVDTASGVESEPGIKDRTLMERFIRAARCAAAGNGGGCGDIAC